MTAQHTRRYFTSYTGILQVTQEKVRHLQLHAFISVSTIFSTGTLFFFYLYYRR
jgi:hypothetical protein